jgi:hypothetical protein
MSDVQYVAASRIKVAGYKDDKSGEDKRGYGKEEEYIEHGDSVSEGDFSEKDWEDLLAARSVMPEDEYKALFPEVEEGFNQAPGTPSNLAQVEGTTLQAPHQPVAAEDEEPTPVPVNPANPPVVEGAGTAEGYDTEGVSNDDKSDKSKSDKSK